MVGHCLLVEAPGGLVLVDTGFGLSDSIPSLRPAFGRPRSPSLRAAFGRPRSPSLRAAFGRPRSRLPRGFRFVAGPRLDPARTAIRQVEALGFDPRDVRDVILTHLDLDHAGGLTDFPEARVHVQADEHAAAHARSGLRARLRYLPSQWAHGPRWVLHAPAGERWRGFDAVRAVPGLPPEILLLPLAGHTRGHQAVAVDTGRGWLLHAGDQYAHRSRMEDGGRCPPQLGAFEWCIAHDPASVRANQARLRELRRGAGDLTVFSAHDADEFERLAGVGTR